MGVLWGREECTQPYAVLAGRQAWLAGWLNLRPDLRTGGSSEGVQPCGSTAVWRTAYGVRQYGVRQYGSTAYGVRQYGVRRTAVRRTAVRRTAVRQYGVRQYGSTAYGSTAVRQYGVRRTAHCPYGAWRTAYGVRRTAYGNTAYGVRRTAHCQYGVRRTAYGSTAYGVRRTAVRRTAVRRTAYGTPSRSSRTPPQCVIWCWLPSRTRSTRRHPGRILLPIEYPSLEILLMECVFSIEFLLIHSSGRPRGFLIIDFLLIPIV